MALRNEIMLITYADGMGRNLRELSRLLEKHLEGAVGGVHLLPFFPSSADRGFAPICYDEVDETFGDWDDVDRLARHYDLGVDFMVNHISRRSRYFQDFLERKDESPYAKMFIRYSEFWPGGEPAEEQLSLIYTRKPRPPYVEVTFADGSRERVWCTFGDDQIDLDLRQEVTRRFVTDTLIGLAAHGLALIRLDAFAYSTKKAGTNCFFVEPEVWEVLDLTKDALDSRDVELLPEIHERYTIQLKLAGRGYWVYDFALPVLLLHTLQVGSNRRLLDWLRICPRKQFTTLDTHDGIGMVDVQGLLSDEEIAAVQERLYARGGKVKRIYNTPAYRNLDIYQINCTYYSALGANDGAYLLARAVQFFAPGIPQVYYVGLLAGENDIERVERTQTGREINRHQFTFEEVEENLSRPVVKRLVSLMRFRNSYGAFSGEFAIGETTSEEELRLTWRRGREFATLQADLRELTYQITYFDPESSSENILTDF